MKKLFLFISLLTLSLSFVSCSSDDDDNDNGITIEQTVANWRATEAKTTEAGSYTKWLFEDTGIIFMRDGYYLGYGYFGTGTGTWKLSGKTITCYVDGKVYAYYDILNVTDNTCELIMRAPNSDSKIWLRCKRIGESK